MKTQVFTRFLILLAIASLGIQEEVFSQKTSDGYVVEGRVNDPQGKKAIGAAILVKGTTIGTVTDTTGFFTLKVPSKESILVISHFSTSKSAEVVLNGSPKVVVRLGSDSKLQSSKEVFDRVEEKPRPVSGENGWNYYMAKNAKYPANDRSAGIEGTVIVGFEVHEDGSLHNIEILRGIGGECDQEVVRLVAEGPNWEPGMINGQAVKTRMSLPVRFVLSKESGTASPNQASEKIIAEQYGKDYLVVVGYSPKSYLR